MTELIFSHQSYVPDHNHVAKAASACLSDTQLGNFDEIGAKKFAAGSLEAKLGSTERITNPLNSLNRLERLVAQETIRFIEKGDVQGLRESLGMLAEIPKMQKAVMTGLTDYMEGFFPRTHVTWQSGKNNDGTPFMSLRLERAHDDSKSSSYTSVEIGSNGTETAYYTAQGNIFESKIIDAKYALSTMKFEKKNEHLPVLKFF